MQRDLGRGAMVMMLATCATSLPFGCGTAQKEDAPTARTSFIALERDFQDFRSWEKIDLPEKAPQGITHVAGQRREYVNQRPTRGGAAFPVGTVLVKELLSEAPEGHQLFAMVKRGGGYNSIGAPGWEWFELRERPDKSIGIVWRGLSAPVGEKYGGDPLGTCSNCHQIAAKNDFVRAAALSLAP